MSQLLSGIVIIAISGVAVGAQNALPRFDAQTAKNHAGERAMVCGQVTESTCKDSGGDVLLTFGPDHDRRPIRIRIRAAGREVFGWGLPGKYDDRVVCAVGTIDLQVMAYEIVVSSPAALSIPQELNAATRATFMPDVFGSCDPETSLPVVVQQVKPRYTVDALARKITGTVLIKAIVQGDGTVGPMQLRRGLDPGLDKEALIAVKGWRFKPATYRGMPVPMVVTMEMTFSLKN